MHRVKMKANQKTEFQSLEKQVLWQNQLVLSSFKKNIISCQSFIKIERKTKNVWIKIKKIWKITLIATKICW